jgi:dUTPase
MRVLYASDNSGGDLVVVDDILVFTASKAMEIQPGEIKKIPTGIVLRVEKGFVVSLSTHPALSAKVGQLFPSASVLSADDIEEYLTLPVHNAGRNPIRVMVGDLIARGHAISIEAVETDTYVPQVNNPEPLPRTGPQKRNKEINFEVR